MHLLPDEMLPLYMVCQWMQRKILSTALNLYRKRATIPFSFCLASSQIVGVYQLLPRESEEGLFLHYNNSGH